MMPLAVSVARIGTAGPGVAAKPKIAKRTHSRVSPKLYLETIAGVPPNFQALRIKPVLVSPSEARNLLCPYTKQIPRPALRASE